MESGDRDGQPVTIEQMMAARERRVARRQAALAGFGVPVVSLGVVMPGPIKDSRLSRSILDAAMRSLDRLFLEMAWTVKEFEAIAGATGPEALYAVEADAQRLKAALVGLEDSHPLGRLWDLDVIDPAQGIVSRRSLGLAPRRCLVCSAEAHACARSQRHSLDRLLAAIEEKVAAYRHAPRADAPLSLDQTSRSAT